MGLTLEINDYQPTAEIEVLVQFASKGGAARQGSYFATVLRPSQAELEALLDPDEGVTHSELLDRHFQSVRGIGQAGQELSPEEQLAWVKRTPECVSAGAVAFLKAFGPERYAAKTFKKRR